MPKVFLTAGHGGKDPGAVGYGMEEKNINLNIMLACRDVLSNNGIEVMCSRTTDEDDPVGQEVKEANNSGADIAVSFHTNAGGGNGSESYYHDTSVRGKKLAELCEKYTMELGQNSRGIKSGKHLYFVKNTKMPAVLCECAFIDNDVDNDIIDTKDKQRAFGVAYANAILEFFDIKQTTAPVVPVQNNVQEVVSTDYVVRVKISNLNIRKGPGTNYDRIGQYTGVGSFTIVEEQSGSGSNKGWGKLKSGLGWISLDYAERV